MALIGVQVAHAISAQKKEKCIRERKESLSEKRNQNVLALTEIKLMGIGKYSLGMFLSKVSTVISVRGKVKEGLASCRHLCVKMKVDYRR